MQAGFEAHLRAGEVTVRDDDVALLRAVGEHGSLRAAADALGRSYSRAHRRVTELEDAVGPLVERRRGGADGGGSALTPGAGELLARFARLRAALAGTAAIEETVFEGTVAAQDGELAEVETPAGTVRAVLREPAERAEVTVRADAVTLHAPAAAPAGGGTSARNRFEGTVAGIDREAAIATVRVDIGAAVPLAAVVTVGSLDRLGLTPGAPVVASFKATAARATPV